MDTEEYRPEPIKAADRLLDQHWRQRFYDLLGNVPADDTGTPGHTLQSKLYKRWRESDVNQGWGVLNTLFTEMFGFYLRSQMDYVQVLTLQALAQKHADPDVRERMLQRILEVSQTTRRRLNAQLATIEYSSDNGKWRTARRDYTCAACGKDIYGKERYFEYLGETPSFQSGKRYHAACATEPHPTRDGRLLALTAPEEVKST
jgi:hypothetical protein